jgi:hypothetical protein
MDTSRSAAPSHRPDEQKTGLRLGDQDLTGTPSQQTNLRDGGRPSFNARGGTPPLGKRQIPAWLPAFLVSLARLVWEILKNVMPWV